MQLHLEVGDAGRFVGELNGSYHQSKLSKWPPNPSSGLFSGLNILWRDEWLIWEVFPDDWRTCTLPSQKHRKPRAYVPKLCWRLKGLIITRRYLGRIVMKLTFFRIVNECLGYTCNCFQPTTLCWRSLPHTITIGICRLLQNQPGVDGFKSRLTSALRTALAAVEYPLREEVVGTGDIVGERDPELGYRSRSSSRISTSSEEEEHGSSSTSTSDISNTGKDSDSTSSSNKDRTWREQACTSRRHNNARQHRARTISQQRDEKRAEESLLYRHGFGGESWRNTSRDRARENKNRKSRGNRQENRKCGRDKKRLTQRVCNEKKATSDDAAGALALVRLTGAGRNVVSSVLKIAANAFTSGWTGMTTTALKIARTCQVKIQRGPVLVAKHDPLKKKCVSRPQNWSPLIQERATGACRGTLHVCILCLLAMA